MLLQEDPEKMPGGLQIQEEVLGKEVMEQEDWSRTHAKDGRVQTLH